MFLPRSARDMVVVMVFSFPVLLPFFLFFFDPVGFLCKFSSKRRKKIDRRWRKKNREKLLVL